MEVVIVGAGPVGLTLACELAARGVSFRLVDQAVKPFEGSRGKTLQPRTLELMDDLGIVDRIFERGEYMPPVRTYLPDGKDQFDHLFGTRVPTSDTPYPRPFTIAQNLTEEILRDRLAELGGHVEYGTELTALAQDEAGVTLTLATAEGEETVRCSYAVGSDGGRSRMRRLLDVAFEGDTDESRRLYVGDLRLSGLDRETWHGFRGPGGMLNIAPLATTDLFQIQASIPPDAPEQPTLEALQEIVTKRSGRDDIRLHDLSWCTAWRLNVRLAETYQVGRAFLAGDACHVHSPAGAQGLNTGFQDAYNLGWKLGEVARGAPATLLDSYSAERRPIAAWMLGKTSELEAQGFEKKGFPADREESMLQLGLNYRDSDLSQELRAFPGKVLAGDRVPDASGLATGGQTRVRLFDLLRGPQVAVLAFGDGWGDLLATLRARYGADRLSVFSVGANGNVEDREGELATNLDVSGDTLLVIRPDNYLGLAVDMAGSHKVESYLQGILG